MLVSVFQVDGVDLRDATHEQAVNVIRNAKSPVTFVVRSLATRSLADSQYILHGTKSDSDGSNSLQVIFGDYMYHYHIIENAQL